MKIEKTKFTNFLKKVKLDGADQIDEVLFDFTTQGLKIMVMNKTSTCRIDAMFKSSAFSEYEAIGKVGIQELHMLIRLCETFDKEVDIKTSENLLTIKSGSRKIEFELLDIQFISEVAEPKVMEFDESITVNSKVLNKFIKDVELNKEYIINLETTEKKLKISNTGKYKFTEIIEAKEAKGGVNTSFGLPLTNALRALTGELQLNLKSQYPLRVVEKTEDSIISIIVAPRIEN